MNPQLFVLTRDEQGLLQPGDFETADVPVGGMWRCECHGQRGWMIRIPGSDTWPDGHVWPNRWCTLDGTGPYENGGWEVSGEAPALTVRPSIFRIARDPAPGETSTPAERGEWHGYITNGELITV